MPRRDMMGAVLLGCGLLGVVSGSGAVWAEEKTLTGEVVDPAAYLKEERRGAEAVDQTYEAVDGGQTLAVLEDGTDALYLLLAEQPGEDPNELVYDYVNQQVRVKGTVYERGGIRGIVAASVEPLAATSQPSATSSPQ